MKLTTILFAALPLIHVSTAEGLQRPVYISPPEAENPDLQQRCQDASNVILTGTPASEIPGAREQLSACEQSGAPAIVHLWSQASGTDETELNDLRRASALVRDGRVFDAVEAIAQDASRAALVRRAALEALVAYFEEGMEASQALLDGGEQRISRVPQPPTFAASVPLPPDAQQRILVVFRNVAASAAPAEVQLAALSLRQRFAEIAPAITPVDLNAVQFEAICGSRLRIVNNNDIALSFTVQVVGAPWSAPWHVVDTAIIDHLAENTGTARLLFAGQEVATAPLGQEPCFQSFSSRELVTVVTFPPPPPPPPGSDDPRFVISTSSQQLLRGVIQTPNPCHDIAGAFDTVSDWILTVSATENIPPGSVCATSQTRFEYRAQFLGMPAGQQTVTVIHQVNGTIVDTFTVTVDVPL